MLLDWKKSISHRLAYASGKLLPLALYRHRCDPVCIFWSTFVFFSSNVFVSFFFFLKCTME
jgi:hypothetical protein